MGRGRQKAKQTKVARKLKYYSPETDYEALQRELQAAQNPGEVQKNTSEETDFDDWRKVEIPPAIDDDWYRN